MEKEEGILVSGMTVLEYNEESWGKFIDKLIPEIKVIGELRFVTNGSPEVSIKRVEITIDEIIPPLSVSCINICEVCANAENNFSIKLEDISFRLSKINQVLINSLDESRWLLRGYISRENNKKIPIFLSLYKDVGFAVYLLEDVNNSYFYMN